MTVGELKQQIKKAYREHKGELFFSERALLSALFEKRGLGKDVAMLSPEKELSPALCEQIIQDTALLLSGEPIQYYLGTEFFCGEEFFVSPGVLIPRPETEMLVEKAAKTVPEGSLVFDFCSGSGCVGIALLLRRPDLRCISFDLSDEALALTLKNREKFCLEERLRVEKMDVLGAGSEVWIREKKPALILSNPPYLTAQEMKEIPENVKREPEMALFGGDDGLQFYRHFLSLCQKTGVPFLCEMGAGQKEGVEREMAALHLQGEFYRDFAGLWRTFRVW